MSGPATDLAIQSARALRAYFAVVDEAHIPAAQARTLLGDASKSDYEEMRSDRKVIVLDADTMQRITLLVRIHIALHCLHMASLANQWLKLPNDNPIFAGLTPLAYMIRDGVSGMQTVCRLVEARVQGQ